MHSCIHLHGPDAAQSPRRICMHAQGQSVQGHPLPSTRLCLGGLHGYLADPAHRPVSARIHVIQCVNFHSGGHLLLRDKQSILIKNLSAAKL